VEFAISANDDDCRGIRIVLLVEVYGPLVVGKNVNEPNLLAGTLTGLTSSAYLIVSGRTVLIFIYENKKINYFFTFYFKIQMGFKINGYEVEYLM
jgi:hypothetical protein